MNSKGEEHMTLAKQLETAVTQLERASERIEQARAKPVSSKSQQEWLVALTDFTSALSEIQECNNESVHEKLHQLASRIGLRQFP
jgi:hypothetical protein